MRDSDLLKQTLPEPQRPIFLPKQAQWLAGEGAGSWFLIEYIKDKQLYEITRLSPKGKVECRGQFRIVNTRQHLDFKTDYQFVHLSHCAVVHIEQKEFRFEFCSV